MLSVMLGAAKPASVTVFRVWLGYTVSIYEFLRDRYSARKSISLYKQTMIWDDLGVLRYRSSLSRQY